MIGTTGELPQGSASLLELIYVVLIYLKKGGEKHEC